MYIVFALGNKVLPDFRVTQIFVVFVIFISFLHVVHDNTIVFGSSIQIWNLTIVKDIINVFQKGFEDDLCITEQEDCLLLINTTVHKES